MNRREMLKYAGIAAAAGLLGMVHTPQARAQGGTLNAVWVHGTSVGAENPESLNEIQRVGWGTLFRGKSKAFSWFHISIPTPVVMNDVRPGLEKVFVLYQTRGASIRDVHIYDGPRKVKSFDGLMLKGDYRGGIVPANTWVIDPSVTLHFALGISVGVQFDAYFDPTPPLPPLEILFTAAGADFRLNPVRLIPQKKLREGVRAIPKP